MAEQAEAPRIKKSKDKKDKKKRKEVEDGTENPSPSKKSRSSAKENGHANNGIAQKSNGDGLPLAIEVDNDQENQHASPKGVPASINEKVKKSKDKSSQEANGDHLRNGDSPIKKKSKKSKESSLSLQNDSLRLASPQRTNPNGTSSQIATAQNSPPPSTVKKPKIKDKIVSSSSKPAEINSAESVGLLQHVDDQPEAMEIDSAPVTAHPGKEVVEKPYIKRSLRSIIGPPESRGPAERSPFYHQHVKFYVPLSPITFGNPLEGACAEHLSPLLLKYYPPLHAVILSWAAPRFSNDCVDSQGKPLARSVAEYAAPMIWLEVDFLLFKPKRGDLVEGMVVLQSEHHIGLQIFNLFSGRIPKSHIPADWVWTGSDSRSKPKKGKLKGGDIQASEAENEIFEEDSGFWVTSAGKKLEGVIKFTVWDVDITYGGRDQDHNLPTIEGTLIEASELTAKEKAEKQRQDVKQGKQKAKSKE